MFLVFLVTVIHTTAVLDLYSRKHNVYFLAILSSAKMLVDVEDY